MPYALEHAKEKQAAANKRFRERHPDRVRDIKAEWYEKNRTKELSRQARWRRANPERGFNGHLLRKYGITREQYDAMLKQQDYRCAICSGPPIGHVKGRLATRLDVDHDHETKKVRGLVCHPCNVLLGQARDRIEILEAAILYLRCSQTTKPPRPLESFRET